LTIGILDYGAGNLGSLRSALVQIGLEFKDIKNTEDFKKCSTLIIPGVGSFNSGIYNLNSQDMVSEIQDFIASGKQILGICLGMHLLASIGTEGGFASGLNAITGSINKLEKFPNFRVPHLGWDRIYSLDSKEKNFVYFAHSYYFQLPSDSTAKVEAYYMWGNTKLPAIICKENIKAFQFHPEKSGNFGLTLLRDALN
jgi:glutamine amidotransferase